jgi:uncharacterized protein (DUF1778 family)
MATLSNDRIDIRINSSQKGLIRYASELRGFKSVSEFVVYCASTEATKIVDESNNILNTIEDKKKFLNALLNPPSPNEALKSAFVQYNKNLKFNGGIFNTSTEQITH